MTVVARAREALAGSQALRYAHQAPSAVHSGHPAAAPGKPARQVAWAAAHIEDAATRRRCEEIGKLAAQLGFRAGGQLARVVAGADFE